MIDHFTEILRVIEVGWILLYGVKIKDFPDSQILFGDLRGGREGLSLCSLVTPPDPLLALA